MLVVVPAFKRIVDASRRTSIQILFLFLPFRNQHLHRSYVPLAVSIVPIAMCSFPPAPGRHEEEKKRKDVRTAQSNQSDDRSTTFHPPPIDTPFFPLLMYFPLHTYFHSFSLSTSANKFVIAKAILRFSYLETNREAYHLKLGVNQVSRRSLGNATWSFPSKLPLPGIPTSIPICHRVFLIGNLAERKITIPG